MTDGTNNGQPIFIRVYGIPRAAGSKTAFIHKKLNRAVVVDASGVAGRDWRNSVRDAALEAHKGSPLDGELVLEAVFFLPRPKSHFSTSKKHGRTMRVGAPVFCSKKPDTTKLVRAVEDALTGIIWNDDAQVVRQIATKMYGERPGVMLSIRRASICDASELKGGRIQ